MTDFGIAKGGSSLPSLPAPGGFNSLGRMMFPFKSTMASCDWIRIELYCWFVAAAAFRLLLLCFAAVAAAASATHPSLLSNLSPTPLFLKL